MTQMKNTFIDNSKNFPCFLYLNTHTKKVITKERRYVLTKLTNLAIKNSDPVVIVLR